MKKKLKSIIIALIVIILVIIITLFLIINRKNNVNEDSNVNNNINNNKVNYEEILDENFQNNTEQEKFEIEKDRAEYLYVEKLTEDFIENVKTYNSDELIKYNYKIESDVDVANQKAKIKEEIQSKLNKNLINEIQADTILANEKIKQSEAYQVEKVYKNTLSERIQIFAVFGEFIESNVNYSFLIALDQNSQAYEIFTDEYINKYNLNEENLNKVEFNINSIEKNKYNIIENNIDSSDEAIAKKYFNYFQYYIKSNPKKIYDILNEEYKKIKFPTYKDFENYAKAYVNVKINKYKINDRNTYNEVICIDDIGRYVCFKEVSVMQFKITLDNYTLNMDSFTSEYNEANEDKKVSLNIGKVSQMVNNGDYNTLYNKLNETFKRNSFNKLDDFRSFINENFYALNRIEIISTNAIDDYYTTRIRVINEENEIQRKLMTIVMKLTEKNDFEMSFSFDEN